MGEIGSRLLRAREARGLTLEDAERDTRISRRYLEALEAEQFEVIPAPVYARGFLRSYSQYLGMDPQELLMLFPRGDEPRGTATTATPQAPTPQQRATMETPIPPTSPSRPQWRKPPRFDMGKTARVEPRPRRREPPPPAPGYGVPAPGETAQDFVIGGGDILDTGSMPPRPAIDVTPPQPAPAAPRPPRPGRQGARPGRRAEAGAAPEEFVIGEAGAARPAATAGGTPRTGRSAPDNQRNLVVLGAMGAILLVVVIAAFLIASLGGDDGGTPAPSVTRTGTAPAGATSTRTGSASTATATSTAAQQGVVPDVTGDTEADARKAIEAAGLQVKVMKAANTQPRGTVTDQSPAARTQLSPGDTVTIVVSEGP